MTPPHGKAHSPTGTSRKSAFCTPTVTQSASFRESPPQSALFRRVRFSSPAQTRRRLTEKRILQPAPHGKAHSARWTSRKSAFCADGLTEKRILQPAPHGKAHSARQQSPRVRLFVRVRPRVRFSVECAFPHLGKRGAASRKSAFCTLDLTEKRILCRRPHGKAHSAVATQRKSAFSNRRLTKKRILQPLLDRSVTEKRSLRTTPHEKHTLRSPDGQATSFCETAQPEYTSDSP